MFPIVPEEQIGMSEIKVPAGVPEMTPEWMTSVLTASGHVRFLGGFPERGRAEQNAAAAASPLRFMPPPREGSGDGESVGNDVCGPAI